MCVFKCWTFKLKEGRLSHRHPGWRKEVMLIIVCLWNGLHKSIWFTFIYWKHCKFMSVYWRCLLWPLLNLSLNTLDISCIEIKVLKPGVSLNPLKPPGTTLSVVKRRKTSVLLICLCWAGAQPLRCKFIYVPSVRSATRRLVSDSCQSSLW